MRTSIKLTAAALSVVALSSCGGGGLDDATKSAISAFDSTWNVTMASATQWVADARAQTASWDVEHEKMEAMMANWDQKTKDAQAANVQVCMTVSGRGNDIASDAQSQIDGWVAEGANWATWKQDCEDGNVSQEDADKGLTNWNQKLSDANAAIAGWQTSWDALASEHSVAEDALMGAMATTE